VIYVSDEIPNLLKNKPTMEGRITPPFKLKPKIGHDSQAFKLKELFGYCPETIVILCKEKNTFQLFGQFLPGMTEDEKKGVPGLKVKEPAKK
jgi:hypothetical protein